MQPSTGPSGSHAPRAAERRAGVPDIRDLLFEPLAGRAFALEVTTAERAVLAGTRALAERASELGLQLSWIARDGDRLEPGAPVCRARGDAWQVVRAEEALVAAIGKASGVATAAANLVALTGGRGRIVCGAWKKVAPAVRTELREAAMLGGAGLRVLDRPFVYLDKNYVRMLGGVAAAVRHARRVEGRAIVVQLRGELQDLAAEAESALDGGADVLMVDTGRVADLRTVATRVRARCERGQVVVAFGGGVHPGNVVELVDAGAEVLDVGRAILDAAMIDFRLDVR